MLRTKLNLGCGSNKIKGYINIDVDKALRPDLALDFAVSQLPYKDKTMTEIVMFHTIEHIQKRRHAFIFSECARVLKTGGKFYLSYPNFWKCAQLWHDNKQGAREFWEKTIFGRQDFPSDFHVCAMAEDELTESLLAVGFDKIRHAAEDHPNEYNSITSCVKVGKGRVSYEKVLERDIKGMRVTHGTDRHPQVHFS